MNAKVGFASPSDPVANTGAGCDDRDRTFVEMLRGFRPSGGLLRDSHAPPLDRARGRPSRPACRQDCAICFEWGGSLWMPRFQFDLADMSIRAGPGKVISELEDIFDGWDMAKWFAHPNLWIGDHRPVDMIDVCLDSVLGAARADRFIAVG